MTLTANRIRLAQFILVAVFALPVLAHFYVGQFTRLLADDYCFGQIARAQGWWQAQIHWFYNWQGTFSSTAVQSAFALLGVSFIRLLPPVLLALWAAAAIWALYQLSRLVRLHYPLFTSSFVSLLGMYAIVDGAPNIYQTLYWTSGSVTYWLPMIIVTAYVGFIFYVVRREVSGSRYYVVQVLSMSITFITAGFSPVIAALLGSGLVFCSGLAWIFGGPEFKREILPLLLAGLIGTILGLGLMLSAPGNVIRQSRFPPPPSLPLLAWINTYITMAFTATSLLIFAPVTALVVLVFSGLWANKFQDLPPGAAVFVRRNSQKLLTAVLGTGLLFMFVLFLPSSYSISDLPPARALLIPFVVLVLVIFGWGMIMGIGLKKPSASNPERITISRLGLLVIVFFLIIGPLRSTVNTVSMANQLAIFAAEWDLHDQRLRAAARNHADQIVLPSFTIDLASYANVQSADEIPHTGTNACMEEYYRINTIIITRSEE